MSEHIFSHEMIPERERQLFYALLDCAGVCYDVNFTQNRILGTPMQVIDGVEHDILAMIGKPKNCSWTEIIEYWAAKMPADEVEAYTAISDIGFIEDCYKAGKCQINHKFWTYDVLGNKMLAEQRVRLYKESSDGDLLGIIYVTNGSDAYSYQKKEEKLSAQMEEVSKRASALQRASTTLPGGYHRCAMTQDGCPFLFVSKSFEALVGYTKEQIEAELDNKFVNLVIPEDIPSFDAFIKAIDDKGHADFAYRIRRRDGEIRWVQDSSAVVNWDGELSLQCTISDITDFVKQQEELSREMADFEQLAENIPCGYHRCTTNNGFKLEFVSESFIDTVGYSKEELVGQSFIDLVAPEDRTFFMSHEPILVNDGYISLVYRLKRKDGSYRWIKDYTIRTVHKNRDSYQCILADITDFVLEQEKIQRQNLRLMQKNEFNTAMENNMPGGYHRCAAAEGWPFLYFGKSFEETTGWTRKEIEDNFNNLFINMVLEEDIPICASIIEDIEKYGYSNAIYRLKKKGGGYIWVSDSTMRVNIGDEVFFHGVIADVSDQIEKMENAKREAEASNLAKSTFLFNASHDIRTPMNAIQGFAKIIEQNSDNKEIVDDAVHKIQIAGSTLMTLMNDILDLSRIERGKEEINLKVVHLLEHGKNLYEMFASDMKKAGIDFSLEGNVTHNLVLCDELKLSRIGMNMLSNAKKFTPAGGTVVFGANEISCDGENVTFEFYARDTGIGMSEDFQKRAFEQFERERTSTESGVSGSGLGLAIIKKLVTLMGGEVFISSKLGQGTKISAVITFKQADVSELDKKMFYAENADMSGKRVLLVEDNEFNREIAKYILEGMKFFVEEAENGLVCVDKILNSTPGYYDLVLMDIQMPIMDGYKATEEIRRIQDKELSSVPIIAMTANAFDDDRRRCFAVGMNGHISKPLEVNSVLKELKRILRF